MEKRRTIHSAFLPENFYLLRKLKMMIVLSLLSIFTVQAVQQQRITGTVKDNSDLPLPGVTVLIKGTQQGTVTNADGVFTIPNVPANATLVFSFVGMQTQEIIVGNQTSINVTMETSAIGLDEVVAIGYGTQKKVNLTGAISVVTSEAIQERPVTSVQQALQGLVPNLNISVSGAGGEPGSDMNMNIRGLSSFSGNTSPYVLVDGIPMGINDIDPNDIETISVLKDAASSAIYGARAANGVILITTKTGKSNRSGANVQYNTNFAFSSPLNLPPISRSDELRTGHERCGKKYRDLPMVHCRGAGKISPEHSKPGQRG